jgi:hypothetical protein
MSQFSHYQINYDHQKPIIKGTVDDVPGQYIENLTSKLKVEIIKLNENDVDFDLIGVDPSFANALRRILLAEVHDVRFLQFTEILTLCSVFRFQQLPLRLYGLQSIIQLFKTRCWLTEWVLFRFTLIPASLNMSSTMRRPIRILWCSILMLSAPMVSINLYILPYL